MFRFKRNKSVAPTTRPVVSCAPINRPAFRPSFPMNSSDTRIAAREDDYLAFLAGAE